MDKFQLSERDICMKLVALRSRRECLRPHGLIAAPVATEMRELVEDNFG
jgi:hypothetical protein